MAEVYRPQAPGWTEAEYDAELTEAFNGDFTMGRCELFRADRADLVQRLRDAERKLDTDLQMFRAMGEQRDAAEERERRLERLAAFADHTRFCRAKGDVRCDCGFDEAMTALRGEETEDG